MIKILLTLALTLTIGTSAYAGTAQSSYATATPDASTKLLGVNGTGQTKNYTTPALKTYFGTAVALNLGALTDLQFGGATMVNDAKTNGDTNFLWSADKTYDELALKADKDDAVITNTSTASGVNIDGADGTRDYNYSNGASAATYTPVFTSKPASGKVRGVIATFGGGSGVCTMNWTNVTRWIGTTGATTTTTLKRSTYLFMVYNTEVVGKIVQEAY